MKIKGYKEIDGHSELAYTHAERKRLEREIKRDLCWEPAYARWALRLDAFNSTGALQMMSHVCLTIFKDLNEN